MMRRTFVYRSRDRWLLSAESKTLDGFWISTPPFVDAGADPADAVLGRIISCLIELSVDGSDSPDPNENLVEPILRLAGAKTYGAFVSGTLCVDVTEEWGNFTITPMRNAGGRGGFVFMEDVAHRLDMPSNEDLGRAVRFAFDKAT